MADLNVTFAGVPLKNPLVLASGTPGWDGAHLREGARAGAGAVVTKTILVIDTLSVPNPDSPYVKSSLEGNPA